MPEADERTARERMEDEMEEGIAQEVYGNPKPEDVQDQLDSEGMLMESVERIASELPDEVPLISNDCWVTVQLKLRGFTGSPEEAVDEAMLDFMKFGLYDRIVIVHDPVTERDYAVTQETVLTDDEIEQLRRG